MQIVIVDYRTGNLNSIAKMLTHLGVRTKITSNADAIGDAEKLILPGVGTFDFGMSSLRQLDLLNVLNHKARTEKVPVLGICLARS